ncbi:hypothetical protein [Verminephrobacter aporrectodeae]|uniref:hypothetical protein n=1 Tax=Verminephrobacter aporrectodeae TaxID=1110389 RepID=UPI0022389A1B|nr:hypothetical protein [Verminephrobacter aporrectodeae]
MPTLDIRELTVNYAVQGGHAAGPGARQSDDALKAMAKWTKADPKDVLPVMRLYRFPTMAEQVSPTWLGGGAAKAMAGTAAFLKEQGRVQEVKSDDSAFVTTTCVDKAMGK